jgi:hypothetical protein
MTQLPLNCKTHYYENFLDPEESKLIYDYITTTYDLKNQTVTTKDGHSYKLNRSTLIFTDEETIKMGVIPRTWGAETPIIIWPEEISQIKTKIEQLTGKKYNICLCNFYKNGKNNIGWHSDKEEYGSVSSIASISLGAEREFSFREVDNFLQIYPIILKNGSLLIMGENCQERYQHRIVPDKTIKESRINLTFRLFDNERYNS